MDGLSLKAPVSAEARPSPWTAVSYRAATFFAPTKPRVVSLIVFTAVSGMLLATPGIVAPRLLLFGAVGIALVACSAAAMNCLLERYIDARMARTRSRPLVTGRLDATEAAAFALVLGTAGLVLLYTLANPLTAWLTFATFFGYAFVYTLFLKPYTPQNIVLGGAAGAMPPVLGWTAVTGEVSADAMLLFLIIFVWTPPHFWSLALYRRKEYAKAGVPMLPVTQGVRHTKAQVLRYTLGLFGVSLLPFYTGMSGLVYFASALVLGLIFVMYAAALCRSYSDRLAHAGFRYSIVYLALLFAALLADHYL
ncbi:MAG: Protoheme farnesyltransferase [Nevskia sp.]|nr:Protoheme farnesyltransferase [Nevskia sp.]